MKHLKLLLLTVFTLLALDGQAKIVIRYGGESSPLIFDENEFIRDGIKYKLVLGTTMVEYLGGFPYKLIIYGGHFEFVEVVSSHVIMHNSFTQNEVEIAFRPNESGDFGILAEFSDDDTVFPVRYPLLSKMFKGNSSLESVVISSNVTSIDDNAFRSCTGLTSVTIPESVTSIGNNAFWWCSSLTYINIPNSVTSIGNSAFFFCISLTYINIPNSVMSIGEFAFENCQSLTSITIPEGVTNISNYAFENCKSLTSINIPEGVKRISFGAFFKCSGLTSITIPRGVTTISNSAFSGCIGLNSISVDDGNPQYDSRDGCNAIIETESNTLIAGCQNTIIPASVTSIGESAFGGCNMTSVTIPKGVTNISNYAFDGCVSLTSINIPEGMTNIGNDVFNQCVSLTSINIPESVTTIGNGIFSGCTGLTSISVDDGNPQYDSRNGCNAIIETESNTLIAGCQNTIIPASVKSIGTWAFDDCKSLTFINIPKGVTNIGNYAFHGCRGLTSVTIPEGVMSIGQAAFYCCQNLTSINIPESVKIIGYNAFAYCSGLTSVISQIERPFAINATVFKSIYTSATLYVPKGTKEKYEVTEGWQEFQEIVEYESINDLVVQEDGTVVGIREVERKKAAGAVYDLGGRAVVRTSNAKVPTAKWPKGVYIRDGKKVLVK